MKMLSFLFAALLLAGCLQTTKPGMGVVQDIKRSPGDDPRRVHETGGAYPTGYYVWVRMEDGTVQTITQISGALKKGDQVRVTPAGKIEKISE